MTLPMSVPLTVFALALLVLALSYAAEVLRRWRHDRAHDRPDIHRFPIRVNNKGQP